jgi:hypothetical protein
MKEADINFIRLVHRELMDLITEKGYYNSLLNSTFEEFDFFFKSDILPQELSELRSIFITFSKELKKYLNANPHSIDPVFVYIDPKWKLLVSTYLFPVLNEIEQILNEFGIEVFKSTKEYTIHSRPSDEEIVSRAAFLYDLLDRHKLVKRHYIE